MLWRKLAVIRDIKKVKGYFLLECALVMAVVAIMGGMSMYLGRHGMVVWQLRHASGRLHDIISQVRLASLSDGEIFCLCRMSVLGSCDPSWREGRLVMVDSFGQVRGHFTWTDQVVLRWRSSLSNNMALCFDAFGATLGQQGSFYLEVSGVRRQIVVGFHGDLAYI
jgi:hypothetical protein